MNREQDALGLRLSDLRGQDEMTNAHFANLIAGIKHLPVKYTPE